MTNKETWLELLKFGVLAPSGDNSQPWKFEIENEKLKIFSVPEKDNPAYNYAQRGTLIAIGALIENLEIAATNFGYKVRCDLPLEVEKSNLIAVLSLVKTEISKHDLFDAIKTRTTNRKPYSKVDKDKISSFVSKFEGSIKDIDVKFVSLEKEIDVLAKAAALNERAVLENEPLHKYFFDHIRWNDDEQDKFKSGLFIKTLELAKPQEKIFNLVKSWSLIKFFNKIGFAKMVASENAKVYSRSSIFGAINVHDLKPETFIEVGKLLEKIWLQAEKDGLSMQMVTGILFFMHRINAKRVDGYYSESHVELIKKSYNVIRSVFGFNNGNAVLMFRLGAGGRPTAISSKKDPIVFIK